MGRKLDTWESFHTSSVHREVPVWQVWGGVVVIMHHVVAVTKKYRIFMDVAGQPTHEPIYHDVAIHTMSIITMEEVIQKYSGKVLLHSSTSHSWEEFAGKHPDDARLITEWEDQYGRRPK